MKKTADHSDQDFVRKITACAASCVETRDFIDTLFSVLKAEMKCSRIDLGFRDGESQVIIFTDTKADYSPLILKTGFSLDMGRVFFKKALSSGDPLIIGDLGSFVQTEKIPQLEPLAKEGVISIAVCPFFTNEAIIGLLCISFRSASSPPQGDGLLTAIMESVTPFMVKTYRLRQMEQMIEMYMEMMIVMSHEIKSPLSSIITLGKTFLSGYFGKIEEKHQNVMDRIVKKAEYLFELANEHLSMSRFESGEVKPNARLVDFQMDILEPAVELIRPQLLERKMVLESDFTDSVYPVLCDPELIRIVLLNFLSNAVKYGNIGGGIRLSLKRGHKLISVSVWNEGPGFPEGEKNRLFKKFYRIQTQELIKRKGTGIGLYLSNKIIQVHGGRISADSALGEWALFSFELPQYMDATLAEEEA